MLFQGLADETACIYVVGQEVTIEYNPETSQPNIRKDKEVNANMVAYILFPDLQLPPGKTFQQTLASHMLSGQIIEDTTQKLLGHEGDGETHFRGLTTQKWKKFVIFCMNRLAMLLGKDDSLEPFCDAVRQVFLTMGNKSLLHKALHTRNQMSSARYMLLTNVENTLTKAYSTPNDVARKASLAGLAQLGKHFPEVNVRIEQMEQKVKNIHKIMGMAHDAEMRQVTMAAKIGIANPDEKPNIIEDYLRDTGFLVQFLQVRSGCMEGLAVPTTASEPADPPEEEDQEEEMVHFPPFQDIVHDVMTRLMVKGESGTNPVYSAIREMEGPLPDNLEERAAFNQRVNEKLENVLYLCKHRQVNQPKAEKMQRILGKIGITMDQFDVIYTEFTNTVFKDIKAIVGDDKPYIHKSTKEGEADKPTKKYSQFLWDAIELAVDSIGTSDAPAIQSAHTAHFPKDTGIKLRCCGDQYELSDYLERLYSAFVTTVDMLLDRGFSYLKMFSLNKPTVEHLMDVIQGALHGHRIPGEYVSKVAEDLYFIIHSLIYDWKVTIEEYKQERGCLEGQELGFFRADYTDGFMGRPTIIEDDEPGPAAGGAAPGPAASAETGEAETASVEAPASAVTGEEENVPEDNASQEMAAGGASEEVPESAAEFNLCLHAHRVYGETAQGKAHSITHDIMLAALRLVTRGVLSGDHGGLSVPNEGIEDILDMAQKKLKHKGTTFNYLAFTVPLKKAEDAGIHMDLNDVFWRAVIGKACALNRKGTPEQFTVRKILGDIAALKPG